MSTVTTPYTYLIGWTSHNTWYYGRRSASGCCPEDLWVSYFTSSLWVKKFRETHGEPDVVAVRRTFVTAADAQRWETRVLSRLNAAKDVRFLNKRNGDASPNFNTRQCANAKTQSGKYLGSVPLSDPRWATGEIVGVNKGIKRSQETKQKQSDQRKNTAVALMPDGSRKRVPLSDPRWATGEIVGAHKGRNYGKQSREHVRKRMNSKAGYKPSDATRQKWSDARKGVKLGPRDPDVVAKNVAARKQNGKRVSEEARARWSNTRKGKKPAFDENGASLGLVSVTDPRWGIDIFTTAQKKAL